MEPAEVESLLEIEDSSAEAWCDVFRRLIINKDKLRAPETAEIVCRTLLRKVEDIGFKDKFCVWKMIHIICFWLHKLHFDIPDNFHLHTTIKRGDSVYPYLLFPIGHFTISGILKLSLQKSEVQVIRLLLNYGYLQPVCVHSTAIMADSRHTISSCRFEAPEFAGQVFIPEAQNKCWNRLQLLDPCKYTNFRGYATYGRGFKRIMLAGICTRVLLNRNTNNAEQFVQCLRLYFRAVADPFVQADEVGELLRFVLSDVSKDSIDVLVQDFQRLYPESQYPYRPRSLKHLCRCVIRQKLASRPETFPVLLDHLGFPHSLKMYIMGNF